MLLRRCRPVLRNALRSRHANVLARHLGDTRRTSSSRRIEHPHGDDELNSLRSELGELRRLRQADVQELGRLRDELLSLREQLSRQPVYFSVCQYNILAGYLGNNTQPWFLYGVPMTAERREQILKSFYEKDVAGKYVNFGWPNYVRGVLSDAEIAAVERINTDHFAWERRKHALLKVIENMDADVLSLVECDNYDEHFKPNLAAMGYDSVWRKRPRHKSMDGCCVAWRRSKFDLVAHSWTEYVDKFDATSKRDRIAVMVLLRLKLTGDQICFVSTHLARNPERSEVDRLRARQVGQVVRAIATFVHEHRAQGAPVILSGDLNATSFNKLRGIASAVALLKEDAFVHPFTFDCADVPSRATSVTSARQMRIDALLYQAASLDLVNFMHVPELCPADPIPNSVHPSDHVPIGATFRLRTLLEMTHAAAKEWFMQLAGRSASRPLCMQALRDAFHLYDHDGSGGITSGNLRKAIPRVMGPHSLDAAEIVEVLSKLPTQEMDFEAFVQAHRDAIAANGMPGLDDLRDAFRDFDKNHDGRLSLEEVLAIFSECSPAEVPVDQLKALFACLDANGDGYVDEEEFLAHLRDVWISRFRTAPEIP